MDESIRSLMKEEIMAAHEKGKMEQAREIVLTLAERGVSAPDIAGIVKISLKLVQEWLSGNMLLAEPNNSRKKCRNCYEYGGL